MVTRLALTETFLKERRKKIMDYKVDCKKKTYLEHFAGSCVEQNLSTANEACYQPFQSSRAVDGRRMWVSWLARQQEEVGEL